MTFLDPIAAEEFISEHPNPVVVLSKGMDAPSLLNGPDHRIDPNFLCAFSATIVTPYVVPRTGTVQFRANSFPMDKMLVALFMDIPGTEVVITVHRRHAPSDGQEFADRAISPKASAVERVRADIRARDYLRELDSYVERDDT